jgi:hypothetical protein
MLNFHAAKEMTGTALKWQWQKFFKLYLLPAFNNMRA